MSAIKKISLVMKDDFLTFFYLAAALLIQYLVAKCSSHLEEGRVSKNYTDENKSSVRTYP